MISFLIFIVVYNAIGIPFGLFSLRKEYDAYVENRYYIDRASISFFGMISWLFWPAFMIIYVGDSLGPKLFDFAVTFGRKEDESVASREE